MSEILELRFILDTLRKRWPIVLALPILMGILGYLYSARQTPIYESTSSIMVGTAIQSSDLSRTDIQTSQQLALTYADIARREPVLQSTIDALQLPTTWSKLRSRVRVALIPDTQLLEIRVEAQSAENASEIANEVARQLILLSPSGAQILQDSENSVRFVRSQLAQLEAKIVNTQSRLDVLETELLADFNGVDSQEVSAEIAVLEGLMSRWQATYVDLLNSLSPEQSVNQLTVIESAQAGTSPVRPQILFNTIVAMAIGLLMGLGLSFLLEFLDTTLKSANDISRVLGLATLGAIEEIKGAKSQDLLVVNHDPFARSYEDYRLLRTKVHSLAHAGSGKTIMVTSAARGEGKSLTVANLGIVMAHSGRRTVIVDANLRQPMIHEFFRLSNQDGLTALLHTADADIDASLRSTLVPNLKILVRGALPSNPSELLGSKRMYEILLHLCNSADVVILDATEAVTVADASVLSRMVDGVLLVVDSGRTERNAAQQAVANLNDAGGNLLGGVLNRAPANRRADLFATQTVKNGNQVKVHAQGL